MIDAFYVVLLVLVGTQETRVDTRLSAPTHDECFALAGQAFDLAAMVREATDGEYRLTAYCEALSPQPQEYKP